jgi:maltooligosyltrehalose trehalohydrolase
MEPGSTWKFAVWAPEKEQMILHITSPFDRKVPMVKDSFGYFHIEIDAPETALQYFFQPDGNGDYPDPASHCQPEGIHGPSQTVAHKNFLWGDSNWKGLLLAELIIYEIHVGTFTAEGNFDAIIARLDELKDTGINALELMPVAAFPGSRNWGYDGVFPYAVQQSYGGPDGLKRLVDACHQRNMAVLLDVVYNHLGPEGNYLSQFGPYFTRAYTTPWGDAINFDGEWSDGVREYFVSNIMHWMENYHIDGLRCDAIHTVFDNGAVHFWQMAHERVQELREKHGREFYLVAESDMNSPKVIHPLNLGGYAFDAQWLDDFHHALYKILQPSDTQRYYDFGSMEQLAKSYKEGFVHSGEWVKFRKRKYGASSAGIDGDKFVVFNNNHDQVGNRAGGERLSMLVSIDQLKIAAAAVLLSPYIPLLFMGEEYGDDTPFYYFVSHSDDELIEAVRKGRQAEFATFGFDGNIPDPQEEATFLRSKIQWEKRNREPYRTLLEWHRKLITLRREMPALKNFDKNDLRVEMINDAGLVLFRQNREQSDKLICLFNFSQNEISYRLPFSCTKLLDSNIDALDKMETRDIILLAQSVVVYRMDKP